MPGRRPVLSAPLPRLCRREIAAHRRRTITFAALFAGVAYLQPTAYRHAYPTIASREGFARSFGNDKAIRLFYGAPHDLLTVGGYTAWRVGAVLAVVAAIWGLLATASALRGEEDARRTETVLALPVSRSSLLGAALTATGVQGAILLAALWAALVAGSLPVGASAFLTITVGAVALVFVGVGALASQVVGTRRGAVELSAAALALAFGLRVLGDTVTGAGWLGWLSPLYWTEQARAFAHPAPAVLGLSAVTGAVLITAALRIARRRDIGVGLWETHDSRDPHPWGLRLPEAFALRSELTALAWWMVGIGGFALLIGMISKSVSGAGLSPALRHELARAGAGSVATPAGYLGFVFLIFVLVLSVCACSLLGAARDEELDGRLETMVAGVLGRGRWLRARLAVATGVLALLSLAAALLAWTGAHVAGADVPLTGLMLAATNCLCVAVLFLGLGALGYALAPRAAASIAYALVAVSFLWQLFGPVLGAPHWLLDLSPFAHLGLAPAHAFRLGPVAVMAAIGLAAAGAAGPLLARRDLVTGS